MLRVGFRDLLLFLLICLGNCCGQGNSLAAEADEWNPPDRDSLLLSPELARETIRTAVALGRPDVIVDVLQVVPNSGDTAYVTDPADDRHEGLLLKLLDYPDQRVQFAAADATIRLCDTVRIPSSYRLLRILARMVATDSAPVALIVDGDPSRASESWSVFSQMGYLTRTASRGREAFRIAAGQAIDFIVVEASVGNWSARDTVVNLKSDQRTVGIPVFLYDTNSLWWRPTDQWQLQRRLRRLASSLNCIDSLWKQPHPGTGNGVYVVPRPSTIEDWYSTTKPVLTSDRTRPLTSKERARYRHVALESMLRIARHDFPDSTLRITPEYQEPVRQMLYDLDLGQLAADVLGRLPSPRNQEELAAAGMNATLPAGTRLAALDALRFSLANGSSGLRSETLRQLLRMHQDTVQPEIHASLSAILGLACGTGHRLDY